MDPFPKDPTQEPDPALKECQELENKFQNGTISSAEAERLTELVRRGEVLS